MFEQLEGASISEKLSDRLYRFRGIDKWPEAEATVWSCEFTPDFETRGCGNYKVTFSYRANGELQNGSLSFYATENPTPFAVRDTFDLKFNPKHPSRFYYDDDPSRRGRVLLVLAVTVGALAAFVVCSLFP